MNMKKYTVETVVDEENTALAVGSGDMEVFATPMMIALMENAAAACIADELGEENTSVGTMISVSHVSARLRQSSSVLRDANMILKSLQKTSGG